MADYLGAYQARKRAGARVCFFNILRLKVGSKVLPLAGSTLQSTLAFRGGRVRYAPAPPSLLALLFHASVASASLEYRCDIG